MTQHPIKDLITEEPKEEPVILQRPWKKSIDLMIIFQVVQVMLRVVAFSKAALIFWKNIVEISTVFANFWTIKRLEAW